MKKITLKSFQPISKRFVSSDFCVGRFALRLISRVAGKRFENGSFHLFIFLSLVTMVFIAASAGAADNADVHDTIELKNGEQISGTVLNDTFTVTTPYTNVTCEKDKISEIAISAESEKNDVLMLKTGGLLEGTIEDPAVSFKLVSGKIISLEKEQCKKIVLERKNE